MPSGPWVHPGFMWQRGLGVRPSPPVAVGALSPWGWDSEVAAVGLPAAIPASGTCKVALWLLLEGGQRFPFPRKGPFGELGRRAQTQVTGVLE